MNFHRNKFQVQDRKLPKCSVVNVSDKHRKLIIL